VIAQVVARWLPTAAFVVVLAGCQEEPQRACTLIGCSSGLQLEMEARPGAPFRIEAEVPGTSGRYVVRCDDPQACARVFLQDFTPERLRIHVIAEDGGGRWLAEPVYVETRPNGPGCPPVCRVGRVVVRAAGTERGP
jgi:hypothetical protein